jgi:hypothetical protein
MEMPVTYGFTKNAEIEDAIKRYALAGKTFKAKRIAAETGGTPQAVTAMIRQMNMNDWQIEMCMGGRNTYYRVLSRPGLSFKVAD